MATDNARKSKWMLIGSIACFILLILFFAFFVDLKKVHAWTAGINPWAVFALLVFLPLVGFPVSVLFVVTGAKFGSFGGIGVVAVAIALHLLLTYWLTTSFLRTPIENFFKKSKYKMP